MSNEPIGALLFEYSEKREDISYTAKKIIALAVEKGFPEKAINNDTRVAAAYLSGYLRGATCKNF